MGREPLDRLRSRKKPVTRRLPLITDNDLAELAEQAKQAAVEARERSDKTPADATLRGRADDLEADYENARLDALETAVWFEARSLSPRVFEDLADLHPPTEKQLRDARKALGAPNLSLRWNVETFQPALIAACVSFVERDESGVETFTPLDESFVKEMFEGDDWNAAEINDLWQLAHDVNSQRRVVDAGKGSRLTRSS